MFQNNNISANENFKSSDSTSLHASPHLRHCNGEHEVMEDIKHTTKEKVNIWSLYNNENSNSLINYEKLLSILSIFSDFNFSIYHSFNEVDDKLRQISRGIPFSGSTAMHDAIIRQDYVKLLLLIRSRYRDCINQHDSLNRTPLALAIQSGDVLAVQLLLSAPVFPDTHQKEPTCENYPLEIEDLTLRALHFPTFYMYRKTMPIIQFPLVSAVIPQNTHNDNYMNGKNSEFSVACGWNFAVNNTWNKNETISQGQIQTNMCEPLLSENTGSSSCQSFDASGQTKKFKFLEEFLKNIVTVYSIKSSRSSWNIDATDCLGMSSLHKACSFGLTSLVNVLLEHGSNLFIKDLGGNLPIHKTIDSGNCETFNLIYQCMRTEDNLENVTLECNSSNFWLSLAERCILKSAWNCLEEILTRKENFITSDDITFLLNVADLAGFGNQFDEVIQRTKIYIDKNLAVDRTIPLKSTKLRFYTSLACYNHVPAVHQGNLLKMKKSQTYSNYPENASRLFCLIDKQYGALRTSTFEQVEWEMNFPPVNIVDMLRVHEWSYIHWLISRSETLRYAEAYGISACKLDYDTTMTLGTWDACCLAAGSAVAAVNDVCSGSVRMGFCIVRPPGHHAGTFGPCHRKHSESVWDTHYAEEDIMGGSLGFCFLNNVAIAAAYARYHYANKGIRRIAIVDIDIHHGNGTQQIVMNLVPHQRKFTLKDSHTTPFDVDMGISSHFWKPWFDQTDSNEVFFVSIHGYGNTFYPNSGSTDTNKEYPNIHNVLLSQKTTSQEFYQLIQDDLLTPLDNFKPDLILISAGFDGHYADSINEEYGKFSEWDYEWITQQLVAISNDHCNGRIVSVLEGGYNTSTLYLSPFAQSVVHHCKALLNTSPNLSYESARILYPPPLMNEAVNTFTDEQIVTPRERLKRKIFKSSE